MRLADFIVEQLTPEERESAQEAAVQRYLERLDRNQWRDPVTGRIVARQQRRARQLQLAAQRGGPDYWRRE